MQNQLSKLPVIFLGHGGGPCFFMEGGIFTGLDKHSEARKFLDGLSRHASLVDHMPHVKSILVISAHWEAGDPFRIISRPSDAPKLLYDYYGFPLVSYTLQYPCVGDRALVKRITEIVGDVEEDTERGYDHGVFIPLKLVIPKADIPVVQLSLHANLSSNLHFELGEKLSALREEGVLIIGSGFTTHNMELMMQGTGKEELKKFVEEARVCTLISDAALRKKKLLELEKSPNFRRAHPRADHWMPFVVAAGAAGDSEAQILYQQWWRGAMVDCVLFSNQ